MGEKLIRDDLIEEAENILSERLVRKRNKTMESFYLDDLKRGRGLFWVDFKKSGNRGFRVHFQKIKRICQDIPEKGYGGYPVIYLNSSSQIPDIIQKLEYIISHFNDR